MKPGVLFVGNFTSGHGSNRTYSEEMADRLEMRGWPVVRTSARRSKPARLADMLATTISQRGRYQCAHVDVFSGQAFVFAELVSFALRRLAKPYALTLRGGNLPTFAERWPRRTVSLYRAADVVTAPSAFLGNTADVTEIPNAIDTSQYRFVQRQALAPRLVWLRAFHDVYNPVLAVDVLSRLGPRAHLTMVGVDKGDGSLERVRIRARELGLDARIDLVGGVPKQRVPQFLESADIFLNTTNVDNTPISVLEAMACGLCVVTTNVGGLPHLVTHGIDGLLTPPNDADAMAQAIQHILDDRHLAASLSSAAREHALRCDWNAVLPRWEDLFASMANA